MTTIIAGGFGMLADAEAAVARLLELGVSRDHMCKYHVNPPGEHNALPAGGDHDASLGAKHADRGAIKGAAIGAAAGLAAGAAVSTLLGPAGIAAGIGLGAYTGSLLGSLKSIDREKQPGHDLVRPAETLLAVNAELASCSESQIVQVFEECGATQIERAEGTWHDGEWTDFDPVTPPHLIGGRDVHAPPPTA